MDFQLTTPENRTYLPNEDYRFLVHIPLGDINTRVNEIGSDRDGILMTSLITNKSQGTFLGRSGIIVDQPDTESVIGSDRNDIGAEIPVGQFASIDELTRPSTPFSYNQIDMKFNGTKPIGVMIKCKENGEPLGHANSNASLEEYARTHNLPIVRIVVEPAHVPTKQTIEKRDLTDASGTLDKITIPFDDSRFLRAEIRRMGDDNAAYHTTDQVFARVHDIDTYGDATEQITIEQQQLVIEQLNIYVQQGLLSDEDVKAITDSFQTKSAL